MLNDLFFGSIVPDWKSFLAWCILDDMKTMGNSSAVSSHFCDASAIPPLLLRSIMPQLHLNPRTDVAFKE
ncbi:hypothetical protein V8E51_011048 [Hyaloscypha variabilis]